MQKERQGERSRTKTKKVATTLYRCSLNGAISKGCRNRILELDPATFVHIVESLLYDSLGIIEARNDGSEVHILSEGIGKPSAEEFKSTYVELVRIYPRILSVLTDKFAVGYPVSRGLDQAQVAADNVRLRIFFSVVQSPMGEHLSKWHHAVGEGAIPNTRASCNV